MTVDDLNESFSSSVVGVGFKTFRFTLPSQCLVIVVYDIYDVGDLEFLAKRKLQRRTRTTATVNEGHNGTRDSSRSPTFPIILLTRHVTTMRSFLSLAALAAVLCAVPVQSFTASSLQRAPPVLARQQTSLSRAFSRVCLAAAEDDTDSADDSSENVPPQSSDPAAGIPLQTPTPLPKRAMDPLLASLTRVDQATTDANKNTPVRKLPLLGEVTMDKSLFLVLPVAAFAVLGLVSSVFVAINSQDAFAEALANNPVLQSAPPSDADGCRGICSSQGEDLENLRVFMNSFGK